MNEPTPAAVSLTHTSPEVHAAARFAVTVTAVEFNMAVGRQRQVFQPNGESAAGGVEYTHAFSMSPMAAKQLQTILDFAIGQYEKAYGSIPVDPAVAKKLKVMEESADAQRTQAKAKPRTTAGAKK